MTKQSQKSGDGSVQIQAQNVSLGLTVSEAKEIFHMLWNENFPQLQQMAKDTANQRADVLEKKLLDELSGKDAVLLQSLSSPRKQNDLYQAQKGFATSNGNLELRDILSRLITDSLTYKDEGEVNSITYSEAIEVASKLAPNHFKILTLLMLMRDLRFKVGNLEALLNLHQTHFKNLDFSSVDFSDSCILHLEYHRCIRIEPFQKREFFNFLKQKYPGFFSLGYPKDQIEHSLGNIDSLPNGLIIPCLKTEGTFQISGPSFDELKNFPLDSNKMNTARSLLENNLVEDSEVQRTISGRSPEMDSVIRKWNDSAISTSGLTLVGKAIAHTYLSTKIKMPPFQA